MTTTTVSDAPAGVLGLRSVVGLLGISQIIGYGTVFYSYAILAPGFAAEFGVDPAVPFSVISAALLISGLVSPFLGRQIDRHGAPRIMVLGSIAVGAVYALAAAAPSFTVLTVLIVILQVIAVAILYGASFPTLAQFGGANARKAITQLTLIAGFASTIFWPLTGWLSGSFGWRRSFARSHRHCPRCARVEGKPGLFNDAGPTSARHSAALRLLDGGAEFRHHGHSEHGARRASRAYPCAKFAR
jgi:MFS family permease